MRTLPPSTYRGTFQQASRSFVVNVRDLGSAGDGKTDDTPAFEAAANRVAAAGGVIYVPPGEYVVRDVWLRSRTWLRGDGAGRSVLRRKPRSIAAFDIRSNLVSAGPAPGTSYTS